MTPRVRQNPRENSGIFINIHRRLMYSVHSILSHCEQVLWHLHEFIYVRGAAFILRDLCDACTNQSHLDILVGKS